MPMTTPLDFTNRENETGVDPLFIERWSPRAHQPHTISQDVLSRIMDAARWAPSCFNEQPWRFFTSTQDTFNDFLNLLVEGNQSWAKETSVIGFLVAQQQFERNGTDNAWAEFDAGAAWMSMSMQARIDGLYTHGMGGIHKDKVAEYLKLNPTKQTVVMGFTIGKLADMNEEQKAANTPNARKNLDEIWTQA